MDQDRVGLVLYLLKQGHTQQAIEVYREETGVKFGEAQLAIEELSRRHGIRRSLPGWIGTVLVLLAGLAGFLATF